MANASGGTTRCAVLVGPYQSGKTALFEALLQATGAIERKGTSNAGNMVGDASDEARATGPLRSGLRPPGGEPVPAPLACPLGGRTLTGVRLPTRT